MHRSSRGGHLVAADDSGQVHLLNYPCVIDKAPRKELGGHCSHVPNVRWLAGDRRVVSAGGHDRTLFQWAVEGDDVSWGRRKWLALGVLAVGGLHGWGWMLEPVWSEVLGVGKWW